MSSRALRPDHALKLLKGGLELFAALVGAIDAARSEVLLETYIFDFNGAPLEVAEALERAAARGVRVGVVVDGVGTGDIAPEWQRRWKASTCSWRTPPSNCATTPPALNPTRKPCSRWMTGWIRSVASKGSTVQRWLRS